VNDRKLCTEKQWLRYLTSDYVPLHRVFKTRRIGICFHTRKVGAAELLCHNRINGCVEVLFENFCYKNDSSRGGTMPQHTDTVPQPTDYNLARVIILAAPGAEVRPA
jgi:hypothetical protein